MANHADCVGACTITLDDPVLDAEGHNKPLRRTGTFSKDYSAELTRLVGERCVVYTDVKFHPVYANFPGSLRPITLGAERMGTLYIFVAGVYARFTCTIGKQPVVGAAQTEADKLNKVAFKIRNAVAYERASGVRARSVAARPLVEALAGRALLWATCSEQRSPDSRIRCEREVTASSYGQQVNGTLRLMGVSR